MRKPAQNGGSSDPASGNGERKDRTGSLEERRRQLGKELASHEANDKPTGADGAVGSPYAKAFQLSAELVAAIFVGVLLGYLLDRFLGTTPWGMIVFLLLGFVAGVLNVMRSAGLVADNRPPDGKGKNDNKG